MRWNNQQLRQQGGCAPLQRQGSHAKVKSSPNLFLVLWPASCELPPASASRSRLHTACHSLAPHVGAPNGSTNIKVQKMFNNHNSCTQQGLRSHTPSNANSLLTRGVGSRPRRDHSAGSSDLLPPRPLLTPAHTHNPTTLRGRTHASLPPIVHGPCWAPPPIRDVWAKAGPARPRGHPW